MSINHETGARGRRWPRVLLSAVAVVLLIEAVLALTSESYMDATPLMYREKMRWAEQPQSADVFVFGDSSAVAAVRPSQLEAFLPEGTEVLNLGMTAVGPTGAEILMRRYLEKHEPPELAVLSFSPRSLADEPPEFFVSYPLTHLLAAGDLLRVVERSSRPSYLLGWGMSRLPSFRYREDLLTGFASLVLDRFPRLQPVVLESLGWGAHMSRRDRFAWRYSRRAERNRDFIESLQREGGWHYFREYALAGERLPAGLPLYSPPFEGAPREAAALSSLVELCREHGVGVLVVGSARPLMRTRALWKDGGEERFDEFWAHLFREHPEVIHTERQALSWPHRLFSDGAHMNPEGAVRYGRHIGPIITETLVRLRDGRDAAPQALRAPARSVGSDEPVRHGS